MHCVDFVENFVQIEVLAIFADRNLCLHKQDSDGIFSTRVVCRHSDSSYNSSLVTVDYQLGFLLLNLMIWLARGSILRNCVLH